eukprot:Clim_evm74s11 gene=Clim_evmTU74s11
MKLETVVASVLLLASSATATISLQFEEITEQEIQTLTSSWWNPFSWGSNKKKEEEDTCLPPVLMIPGLAGSVLDIKLEKGYKGPHWICFSQYSQSYWSSGLTRLWPSLDATDFVWPHLFRDCWEHAMTVSYNATTDKFEQTPHIEVRGRDWGGVRGISNLFDIFFDHGLPSSDVFEDMVVVLEKQGYKNHKQLRGAPYDFRLIVNEDVLTKYFEDVKKLVEEMYDYTEKTCSNTQPSDLGEHIGINDDDPGHIHRPKKPVLAKKGITLISHSLGGPVMNLFLSSVDQAWKDKYINRLIAVSAPWEGASRAVRTALSGETEGLPGFNISFLPIEKYMSSLYWMFPNPGSRNDTVVKIGEKEYTDSYEDLEAMFATLNRTELGPMMRKHYPKLANYNAPLVDYYAYHGIGQPTEHAYVYDSAKIDGDPDRYCPPASGKRVGDKDLLYPDGKLCKAGKAGDGTVWYKSLAASDAWKDAHTKIGHAYERVEVAGGDHLKILRDKGVIKHVVQLLASDMTTTSPPVIMTTKSTLDHYDEDPQSRSVVV